MPRTATPPQDLEDMLDELRQASRGAETVSVGDIQEIVGRRSFGPLLLVAGLIVLTPIGGIPGVPTLFGLFVLLIAGQLVIGQEHFWLPAFISNRSFDAGKLAKGANRIQPAAAFIDRFLRPRLTALTLGDAQYGVAVACVLLALATPFLEVLPMAATAPAFAIAAFGLALVSRDGALALLGYAATAVTAYLIFEAGTIVFAALE